MNKIKIDQIETILPANVGLGNVNNTSDVNKPISTATQTALNLKADITALNNGLATKENTINAGLLSQYYRGDKSFQTLDKTAVGLANVDNTADTAKPVSTAQQTALNLKQDLSLKDSINGYAGLDASGKINPSQLPALAITDTFIVISQAAQVALTVEVGDIAVRTDINKSYILRVSPASVFANWQELLTPTDSVASVFGRTGVVTAQNADYVAGQITNTPSGNIAAVTVQAAITELDAEKENVANKAINFVTLNNTLYPSTQAVSIEMGVRDTANRARANHTGTQLSATVSDFLATVLGSVLTGFTVGTRTAIVATDTILQAFSKVQKYLNDLNAQAFTQAEFSAGNSGTALSINWANGVSQVVTMTGNCTFTFSTPPNVGRYQIRLVQDATGTRTAVFPTTKKVGNLTLSTAVNKEDILSLYWNGTSYYAILNVDFI